MARSIKQSSSKKKDSSKSYKRKHVKSFNMYIYRTLKQIHKDVGFSSKGMKVLNSFVKDIFERLSVEAAALTRFSKCKTMTSREIQTAVRLTLPGELAKHAMAEGTKAVAKLASK